MPDADVTGTATNPATAATAKLFLKLEGDLVLEAAFQSDGCAATIAACSMLTVMLKGKVLDEAEKLDRHAIEGALGGLPPTRRHAALLAEDALRSVLRTVRPHAAG